MIGQQLVPSDVAGIHAGHRMVHEQMHIDIIHACHLPDRPIGLTEVIPPFRQLATILFMFLEMAGGAIGRKESGLRLDRVCFSADPKGSNKAPDHFSRERDIECTIRSAFRLRDVQDAAAQIEMRHACSFDRIRSTATQQQEKVKLPPYLVLQTCQFP